MVDVVLIGDRTVALQTTALAIQRSGYTVLIVPVGDRETIRDLDPCLVIDTTDVDDDGMVAYRRSVIDVGDHSDPDGVSVSMAHVVAMAVSDMISRHGCRGRASRRVGTRDIELDLDGVVCTVGGRAIDLTPTEFRLLAYLVDNVDVVVSKHQILERVFDFDGYQPNVVEVHISSLRRKIDGDGPQRIETVRSIGYVIRSRVRTPAHRAVAS